MVEAWEVCLSSGISWETYWALTAAEVAALADASTRIADRKKRQQNRRR